jgi:hypothetical protein
MTQLEALTQALYLGIIAPTDEQSERITKLLPDLSLGLSPDEIEQCKTDALILVRAE